MRSPLAFMRFVAKAALNAVGFGVAGDLAVEVLPDVARDVWKWWGKDAPPEQVRKEVEAVAQLKPEEAHKLAEQAIAAEAADKSAAEQKALTAYLELLPLVVRQSLKRPEDPLGSTVAANVIFKSANDVMPLLPARLPRFKRGDRPAGVGDWVLDELLGMGGFGEVWRAKNPHLPDPVALKFCLDLTAAQWLRHEAALLGRVISQGRHPGIVALLDTYLSGDPPCLKYEYVAGGDLCGLITQWQQLAPTDRAERATRLMHQLADIVTFAHHLSPPIVHRDLKPANILLQPTPGGGFSPRVADFGIGGVASRHARAVSQRGSTQGYFLGTVLRGSCTPLYASPQQMRGEDPDPRDDVHALGVIWFQLLTGDLTAGASADWRDEVEPLGVSDGVLRLLGACLSSRADRRPSDAGVLAQELAALLPAHETPRPGVPATPTPPRSGSHGPAATRPYPPPRTPTPPPAPPRRLGPWPLPAGLPRFLTNSLGMKFVLIPAGTFRMGSASAEQGRSEDEGPQHVVTITRAYYLGVHPVTQMQFQRLMGTNPSHFSRGGRARDQVKGEDTHLFPVEKVTWGIAGSFCRKLSELDEERRQGHVHRLPTEAEWEHACRAGKDGEPFHFGVALTSTQANFDGSQPYGRAAAVGPYLRRPTAVGSYPPNAWGLFDMHGNVWEWCADWYAEDYYVNSPEEDPSGPQDGRQRVLRGGCWSSPASNCHSAYRGRGDPESHLYRYGFRVLLEVPAGSA
jgi:formylglycine-generating enzyme required for sulfatase activity